jgi:hypothetical protein
MWISRDHHVVVVYCAQTLPSGSCTLLEAPPPHKASKLTCICEVPGWNLDRDIKDPDWGFSMPSPGIYVRAKRPYMRLFLYKKNVTISKPIVTKVQYSHEPRPTSFIFTTTAVANRWSARKFWWSVEKFGRCLQFLCLLYCFIILFQTSSNKYHTNNFVISAFHINKMELLWSLFYRCLYLLKKSY